MEKKAKIFVAGGKTLLGSGILRALLNRGFGGVIAPEKEPDLTDSRQVTDFFRQQTPEYVFLVAGKSGGILANTKYPADFMLDNLLNACFVIDQAHRSGVKKLLYLASSCCYPRHCPQPMREEYLLTAPLEPTNEPYAVAKIAGMKLVQACRSQYGANFICAIPANCFGPGDDFGSEDSHVIGALLRRMDDACRQGQKEVTIWGTGSPRREFIFVDDLADACLFTMNCYDRSEPINLGPGEDVSIAQLAALAKAVTGFPGELVFDRSKPDGMPLKLLDTTKLKALGWKNATPLEKALRATYSWYRSVQREEETKGGKRGEKKCL